MKEEMKERIITIVSASAITLLIVAGYSELTRRNHEVTRTAPTPSIDLSGLTRVAQSAVDKLDRLAITPPAQSGARKEKIVYKYREKIKYRTKIVTQTRYVPVLQSPVIVAEPQMVRMRMEQKKYCNIVINQGLRVSQCVRM